MQLLPCNRPTGSLETAPATSLRQNSEQETWDGFWGTSDEAYYARCTYADGTERWFRIADELPREERYESPFGKVIRFSSRRAVVDVTTMRLMTAKGRRPILVGTSRRRMRPAGTTH